MKPVIEAENLEISLNNKIVLESVTFRVNAGDFFAIIGPNGAGKTTLIRAILGLIPVRAGSIRLFGEPVSQDARRRIGYVPQYQMFDFQFPITVREMVLTGRLGRKDGPFYRYSPGDHDAAEEALSRIAAGNLINRPISDLSGGERQRMLIARALAGEPEILILDEPSVFVDAPTEEQFYELLSSLSKTITILMITHDIGVVSRHVTRIACLNRTLFVHDQDHITAEMIARTYGCPVDLITHGDIPHRVLAHHGDRP